MNRLQKKCLMASGGMHAFLVLLLVFGSAFFAPDKPPTPPMLNVVPTRLVDAALAGGGGNPNLAPTTDRIKGDTLTPVTAPPQPEPAKQQPKRDDPPIRLPDPPKVEVKKTEPVKQPTKQPAKEPVKEPVKTADEAKPSILSELKKIDQSETKKQKAKDEAEAREREAAAARKAANARAERAAAVSAEVQKALSGSLTRMKTGFNDGVAVDVGGPGGEAFADYKTFVQMAYDNAWVVTPELTDASYAALIRVTIARSGRIIASRIIRPSGSSTMDRTIQRAMDRVRADGLPPFPAGATDSERSFTIEFNLKSKNRTG